jgi:hypothetical protein
MGNHGTGGGGDGVSATNSTIIQEWDDDPEDGREDEWPYPNHYIKSLITGELADRVRARLDQPAETPVLITETQISGGWSEYTQETDYEHRIDCGPASKDLGTDYLGNGLKKLLEWLDEATR